MDDADGSGSSAWLSVSGRTDAMFLRAVYSQET